MLLDSIFLKWNMNQQTLRCKTGLNFTKRLLYNAVCIINVNMLKCMYSVLSHHVPPSLCQYAQTE